MSTDGLILAYEGNFNPGYFAELKPFENPVSTLLAQKGWRLENTQAYGYTTHTNYEATSANLKADNASPTYGSSGFSTGSNTVNIFFEGAQVSWARLGAQNLGRTLAWQGPTNPSFEPDPMDRAVAEALGKMKSEFEYIGREGVYNLPQDGTTSGTTGTWQQRGYRYAPGIVNKAAGGAVAGAGTLGTYGTLTRTIVIDALQSAWSSRMWEGGRPLTCFTNATAKRQLTDIFLGTANVGQQGVSRVEAGVSLETFTTDFGKVDVVLTHNIPTDTMYFLNLDQMQLVARPVPGMGVFFEKEFGIGNEKANKGRGIYAEIGIDHGVGSSHIRVYGIGSSIVGGQAVSAT